jgi:hypothetical protein
MPAEPVSVRGAGAAGWHRFDGLAFAPSACGTPGENLRCFRDRAAGSGSGSGAEILWPQDETACWALGPHTERELRNGARHPVTRYGKTMVCPVPNYPDAGVGSLPHCWDAWGRRVDDAGGAWILDSYPEDRFTGWYHGLCPPATMPACPQPSPTPRPTPGPPLKACSLPAMPESGANGRDCDGRPIDSRETGIYGCCRMVEDHGAWAGPSQFADALEAVLDEMVKDRGDVVYPPNQPGEVNERLEDAFMADLVGRLRARGLCATRGGPSDEVGIKGENGRSEQFDVVLSEGKVRRRGYVAVCRPARF